MAIVSENERIKHTNETNKTELHGRKLEYMNTVAAKLKIAMRTTAPIKLKIVPINPVTSRTQVCIGNALCF